MILFLSFGRTLPMILRHWVFDFFVLELGMLNHKALTNYLLYV
jgi:hypothetical protein